MAPKLQLQLPRGQQRLQQIPRVRMSEEAWGSDNEEPQGAQHLLHVQQPADLVAFLMHQLHAERSGAALPAPKTPAVLLHEQKLRERQQQADDADRRPDLGPLRLQDLCLSESLTHICVTASIGLHCHACRAVH